MGVSCQKSLNVALDVEVCQSIPILISRQSSCYHKMSSNPLTNRSEVCN